MTKGLHAIETASRDEIVALQTERLKWTLNHVYDNVPHYQASFDAAGVHPDDFKSLDDLRKFPFTTKQDLRDNYPYRMFAVPRSEVVRIHASSGTTGKPTVVGYTQRDIVRSTLPAAEPAISSMLPTATAFLPAASERITVPKNWAVRSFRCLVGRLKNKSS